MKRRKIPLPLLVFWVAITAVVLYRSAYELSRWFYGDTIVIRHGSSTFDYLLRFPKGYTDFRCSHPLIIFLHGAGETGKDVGILKRHDPYHYAKTVSSEKFPFIVVSPMSPTRRWQPDQVAFFLEELLSDSFFANRIDTERIYLTGFSMGAFGTFDTASAYPTKFAAIVPLAGGGDIESAGNLLSVPTWAFHGDADDVVDVKHSQEMIAEMTRLQHPDARLTVLHGAGHGIPCMVYSKEELYEWLLKHRRRH